MSISVVLSTFFLYIEFSSHKAIQYTNQYGKRLNITLQFLLQFWYDKAKVQGLYPCIAFGSTIFPFENQFKGKEKRKKESD
jgi:hypothetical protein